MSSTASFTTWQIPKTVLSNNIHWPLQKIPGHKPGTWSGKDDQLWRCRKTKKFEASLLSSLPLNSTFVDAGAHYGDTVVTMALYARDTLKREDLRFMAFEPNGRKVEFIEGCVRENGLEGMVKVVQCVLGDKTVIGGARVRRERAEKFCEFDGRTSYELVNKGSCCADVGRESETSMQQKPETVDKSMKNHCEPSKSNEIDDGNSCNSNSSSTYDFRRLDDFYHEIHPLGFLHLDVEGWEARVLVGASSLLSGSRLDLLERESENNNMPNKIDVSSENNTAAAEPPGTCYVIAETFSAKEARRRGPGFSLTHDEDIMAVLAKHPDFVRGKDVVDGERNLFFARNRTSGE
mmetsp:Transcript_17097/g.35877  ORF Transcript_17097/g.35877 Transcript_17097/m.35877 type:complete len:349 (+) Transcript_17097:58-1104(+)